MRKFLKSAGIPAIFAVGAAVSAQAADVQVEAADKKSAPVQNTPARFALTASDSDTSSAIGFALNKHIDLTVEGYLSASATFSKLDRKRSNGTSGRDYTLFDSKKANLDAAFLGLRAANKQTGLSAYASILWVPNGKADFNEAGILDAYLQWQKVTGAGTFTVTGGKYLSYYGLESFYVPNMHQLTYGLQSFLPSYHTGIKLDYASKDEKLQAGFSIADSLHRDFNTVHFFQGDGKFKGIGLEAMVGYQFSKEFKLTAIVGYDTKPDSVRTVVDMIDLDKGRSDFVFDIIAAYQRELHNGGVLAFEGELTYENRKRTVTRNNEQNGWALVARYTQVKGRLAGLNGLVRVSGNYKHVNSGVNTNGHSLTLSPGYAFNKHFQIRGEFTWTHGRDGFFYNYSTEQYAHSKNQYFFGVQSLFTF